MANPDVAATGTLANFGVGATSSSGYKPFILRQPEGSCVFERRVTRSLVECSCGMP